MHTSIFLAAAAALLAAPAHADDDAEMRQHGNWPGRMESRVVVGYRIAPVALDLRGKNPALVGLGSYLVNATGGCNDCHTHPNYAPGGDPFQGQPEMLNTGQYFAGGRQFGPVTSANITPDEFGRPAGLTREEFVQLMRTGRDPHAPLARLR